MYEAKRSRRFSADRQFHKPHRHHDHRHHDHHHHHHDEFAHRSHRVDPDSYFVFRGYFWKLFLLSILSFSFFVDVEAGVIDAKGLSVDCLRNFEVRIEAGEWEYLQVGEGERDTIVQTCRSNASDDLTVEFKLPRPNSDDPILCGTKFNRTAISYSFELIARASFMVETQNDFQMTVECIYDYQGSSLGLHGAPGFMPSPTVEPPLTTMVPTLKGANVTFNLVEVRDYLEIFAQKTEFESRVQEILADRLKVPQNFITQLHIEDVIPYNETVAQEVEVKFIENFTMIVETNKTGFTNWVRSQIANFFGVNIEDVTIKDVKEGSIIVGFVVNRKEEETQEDFELKVERFHNLTKRNALGFTEPFTNITLPTQPDNQSLLFSIPKYSLSADFRIKFLLIKDDNETREEFQETLDFFKNETNINNLGIEFNGTRLHTINATGQQQDVVVDYVIELEVMIVTEPPPPPPTTATSRPIIFSTTPPVTKGGGPWELLIALVIVLVFILFLALLLLLVCFCCGRSGYVARRSKNHNHPKRTRRLRCSFCVCCIKPNQDTSRILGTMRRFQGDRRTRMERGPRVITRQPPPGDDPNFYGDNNYYSPYQKKRYDNNNDYRYNSNNNNYSNDHDYPLKEESGGDGGSGGGSGRGSGSGRERRHSSATAAAASTTTRVDAAEKDSHGGK